MEYRWGSYVREIRKANSPNGSFEREKIKQLSVEKMQAIDDAIRFALIPGTLQQKVKDVVGKGRVLGQTQMIGKNKVHLAPVNR